MSEFTSRNPGKPSATALSFDTSLKTHGSVELLIAGNKAASDTIKKVKLLPQPLDTESHSIYQRLFSEDLIVLNLTGMKSLTGMSRATIYRYCLQGRLPKPHRLGSGQNRWLLSEVRPYLEAMVGKTQGAV
jgi:predicted DNA-binding transcriptional regulator AlpA